MGTIYYPTNGENKMTPETKALFEKTLSDPNVSNETIVVLFNSLNSGDNMATTNPELFALFAKAFMDRNIDLRDYITESKIRKKVLKVTKPQLKRIIRESLEQVDWDNPQGSWDSNDQENWENEQVASSMEEYVDMHIDDFVDGYIRMNHLGADSFMDWWEYQCEENGISCTQDELEALVLKAEEMGEVEEGELFIGDRGAW